MSNLYLQFECFAGSDIRDAIEELCTVASRVGCVCKVNLNGVTTMAHPRSDPFEIHQRWKLAQESKQQYKIVCGQPINIPRDEAGDVPAVSAEGAP